MSAVMRKFGSPKQVIQSTKDAETLEYTTGKGVKTYTFQGDECVKQNSRKDY